MIIDNASVDVSTHSRLKAAAHIIPLYYWDYSFNTQPPEGGWCDWYKNNPKAYVSTHSRLKAAAFRSFKMCEDLKVSTHSRLKAAVQPCLPLPACTDCFNTQPPEGGCRKFVLDDTIDKFQHTAA